MRTVDDLEWLEPWTPIAGLQWPSPEKGAQFREGWENQLKREVGPRHVLFGVPASLIARRFDTDDALFQLPEGRVAEVHLTWSKTMEPDPRWPGAAIFDAIDDWARQSMKPQHEEWLEGRDAFEDE